MGARRETRATLALLGCIFMASCSPRHRIPNQTPPTEPAPGLRTLGEIPHHSEEEQEVAAYRQYYERFRNIGNDANLSIRDEARLAEDYLNAMQAFNQWLQFVTDSIQDQSALEPKGAAPGFRYG